MKAIGLMIKSMAKENINIRTMGNAMKVIKAKAVQINKTWAYI